MKLANTLLSFALPFITFFTPYASAACIPQPDLAKVFNEATPEQSKDAGFLWQIEKNGRISHLYGTIHILPKQLVVPGRNTMLAIQSSDAVAVEVDILDTKLVAEFLEEIKRGPDLMKLSPAQKQEAVRLAKKLCVDNTLTDDLPWSFKYLQITVAQARTLGFESVFSREIFLSILAKELKKPVLSLETAKVQAQALTRGWDVPSPLIDKYLGEIENGTSNRVISSMVNLWATNQLEQLADIEKWCECKGDEFQKRLLTEINDGRNPGMAAELDRLHASGQKVFAAIGALHMTGPLALPKLMEQKGYVVRRVF
jgi:uncharacterized protein